MNPVPLFLIIVSLPLLLGGCEEKPKLEGINYDELELREGLSYVKGSNAPYTGKVYELYLNRKKEYEIDFLNGKEHGLYTSWYQNGQKKAETN